MIRLLGECASAPLLFAWHTIVVAIHFSAWQWLMNQVASLQEVICEQWVRPSQRNSLAAASLSPSGMGWSGAGAATAGMRSSSARCE
ncbi:hypothetical protein [Aquabacterium sp. CECT 9606]|uniref:hypothetical protein n=1 Tax=Aquabacterium sp. CECT 9606 TaxID=2845822 RepID=UPI001E552A9D|nr:hypothetical protein [Aquabacterium sp. CECT 9606]